MMKLQGNRQGNRQKEFQSEGPFMKKTIVSILLAFASLPLATIAAAPSIGDTGLFPLQGTTYLDPPEESKASTKLESKRHNPEQEHLDNDSSQVTKLTALASRQEGSEINAMFPRVIVPENSHLEVAGHTIGDSHRSIKSSQNFFASVDLDGDGQILKPELSHFLAQMIGGSAFDEAKEIENEVGSIMNKLDLEGDGKLEIGDVQSYWEKLESLLTTDEVAEWIVHAGQLPKEVGEIFRVHSVTGYDFPELVENNGHALKEELNIDKSSYRKRIIRAVNSRLFGIGTVPSTVKGIEARVESCSTIALHWEKAHADNLPVHKYRVMRRKIGGESRTSPKPGNHSKVSANPSKAVEVSEMCNAVESDVLDLDDDVFDHYGSEVVVSKKDFKSCELPKMNFDSVTMTHTASEWKLVYDGSEQECVDGGLEPGKGYIYRIQGWNLVGKSSWSVLDPSDHWISHGCHFVQDVDDGNSAFDRSNNALNATKTQNQELPSFFLRFFRRATAWGTFLVNAVMTLAALSTALMRYRRSTITSTAAKLEPLIPWIFRRIDKMFNEIFGLQIVPESFMMENHDKLQEHDNAVKLVGLNGYRNGCNAPSAPANLSDRSASVRAHPERGIQRFHSEPNLTSNPDILPKASKGKPTKKSPFSRRRSPKIKLGKTEIGACAHESSQFDLMPSVPEEKNSIQPSDHACIKQTTKRGNIFRIASMSGLEKLQIPESASVSCTSNNLITQSNVQQLKLKARSISLDSFEEVDNEIENHNLCNTCSKKYKFPKRCRHHCAKCGSTFCHKHGNTTHSNLIACKVPGTCVCNVCLDNTIKYTQHN
eukprot:scaffold1872_cov268-Chaetoceros_neogracile.AAC.29